MQPDRDLAPVAHCPTLFQERIEGVDVRVHVVGRSVFATRMTSDADDYRYDTETRRESMAVPERIAHRCVQLSDSLGLLLAGCDFRVTPSGRWVCFEVNPSPAFTYFEPRPETPIAEAVAELLRDADSGPQGNNPAVGLSGAIRQYLAGVVVAPHHQHRFRGCRSNGGHNGVAMVVVMSHLDGRTRRGWLPVAHPHRELISQRLA